MFTLNPDYFKQLTGLKAGDLPLLIGSKSQSHKVMEKILAGESLPQILTQVDQLLDLLAAHDLPKLESLSAEEIHEEYTRNRMVIEKLLTLTKKEANAPK